jgi:hypothetical protein
MLRKIGVVIVILSLFIYFFLLYYIDGLAGGKGSWTLSDLIYTFFLYPVSIPFSTGCLLIYLKREKRK